MEAGYYKGTLTCANDCTFDYSQCSERCGDDIVQENDEDCEASSFTELTCAEFGVYGTGNVTCGDDCRYDFSQCGGENKCGDSVIQAQYGETCDNGNLNGQTCETLGYYGGTLSCSNDCTFNTQNCELSGRCGDSTVQTEEEDCDGTNLNNQTCATQLNFDAGTLLCNSDCTFDYSNCSECGDGSTTGAEECDGNDYGGNDCISLGYYGGTLSCNNDCTYAEANCATFGYCGDGTIQTIYGENCEGANLNGKTNCHSLNPNYYDENVTLLCSSCDYDLSMCRSCGDNKLDADFGEQCDGTDFGGTTCSDLGYDSGSIACNTGCAMLGCSGKVFTRLVVGLNFACAQDSRNDIWCWGSNTNGQLGTGDSTSTYTPTPVEKPDGISFSDKLSSGINHTCVVDTNGDNWCWGDNSYGQFGNLSNSPSNSPVTTSMPPGISFTAVAAGFDHTCAIDTIGNAWCWGSNGSGQLGNNSSANSWVPVPVEMPQNKSFNFIAAGGQISCATDTDGGLWCWGSNYYGLVGVDYAWTPQSITVPSAAAAINFISITDAHACVLDTAGNGFCWGDNSYGAIGAGNRDPANTPTPVLMPTGAVFNSIAVSKRNSQGRSYTCASDTLNRLWCWGSNGSQELGIAGGTTYYHTPQQSIASSGILVSASIAVKNWYTGFVDTNGKIQSWGDNYSGQLGIDPVTMSSALPVQATDPEFIAYP